MLEQMLEQMLEHDGPNVSIFDNEDLIERSVISTDHKFSSYMRLCRLLSSLVSRQT